MLNSHGTANSAGMPFRHHSLAACRIPSFHKVLRPEPVTVPVRQSTCRAPGCGGQGAGPGSLRLQEILPET